MSNYQLPASVYDPTAPERKKWIGAPMKRKEDPTLITGRGEFFDDVNLKGMLYCSFYRSPYAHARIKSIDLSEVLKMPGVVTAITGEDLVRESRPNASTTKMANEQIFAMGTGGRNSSFPGTKPAFRYGLAVGKVKFDGDPVVAVVATDRYLADDAMQKVIIDFEPLPAQVDPEKAMLPGAVPVNDEFGTNIAAEYHVEGGDIAKAFAEADKVVKFRLKENRHCAAAMECRGAVASYVPFADQMTIWVSLKGAGGFQDSVAEVLGMPSQKVRVLNRFVGGDFGEKSPGGEEMVVCFLSKKLGLPVKWTGDRTEHIKTTGHARDEIFYIEAAATKKGKILGMKVKQIMDGGYYVQAGGIITAGFYIPGPYHIDNYVCDITAVTTNKAHFSAYRALIKIDADWAMERTCDIVAQELHITPAEVRLANFIQPEEFPYKMVTGCIYDSGDYPAAYKRALKEVGYDEIKANQAEWRKKGKYVGVAATFALEPTGPGRPGQSGADFSTIRIGPKGEVTALQGISASQGQGRQTTTAQIIADELGVTPDMVTLPEGDTTLCKANGTGGSSFSVKGVSAIALAARSMRKKVIALTAYIMKVDAKDLEMMDGRIYLKSNPEKGMKLSEVAAIAHNSFLYHAHPETLPPGMKPGELEVTEWFCEPNIVYQKDDKGRTGFFSSFPYAAAACAVEVDIETGNLKILKFVAVHDCGVLVNPAIMEVQDQGAFIQGLGGTLYEQNAYSEEGNLLNPNFMDYLTPGINEAFHLDVIGMVTPSPYTILGTKGGSETTLITPFISIAPAIEDALQEFGARITWSLLTPQTILPLTQKGKMVEVTATVRN